MYAVLKTGGKQYRVAENDVITVEKLAGEVGSAVSFDSVLMVDGGAGATVGTPLVEGALVTARILDQKRGEKIIVFKKKRRKNYRRTQGHRQYLTVLRITGILPDGEPKPDGAAETADADSPPEVVASGTDETRPGDMAAANDSSDAAIAADDATAPDAGAATTPESDETAAPPESDEAAPDSDDTKE